MWKVSLFLVIVNVSQCVYVSFSISSGHGVILEGTVVDFSRHAITDVKNRKVKCLFVYWAQNVSSFQGLRYCVHENVLYATALQSLGSVKSHNYKPISDKSTFLKCTICRKYAIIILNKALLTLIIIIKWTLYYNHVT